MDISNPRRILAVSLEGSAEHLSRVVKDLTGSSPELASTSLAGTTHNLDLKTPYYTASVPIWLDLIASPPEWCSSFLSDEAREVLAVLGGLVLVFAIPGSKPAALTADDHVPSLIRHVGRVVQQGLGGWEWDGVRLAVGIGEGEAEEWDELCAEAGLEFVQLGGAQLERNEYGEKTGISRVREALESNDWAQLDDPRVGDFGDFEDFEAHFDKPDEAGDFDPESLEFGVDRADFEGLRKAIWETGHGDDDDDEADEIRKAQTPPSEASANKEKEEEEEEETGEPRGGDKGLEDRDLDDEDVAKVEKMMRKLQAAREMGEGMSEAQRKRLAARAVEEVMREL